MEDITLAAVVTLLIFQARDKALGHRSQVKDKAHGLHSQVKDRALGHHNQVKDKAHGLRSQDKALGQRSRVNIQVL